MARQMRAPTPARGAGGQAMTFVDASTEERIERLLSEMRNEARTGH